MDKDLHKAARKGEDKKLEELLKTRLFRDDPSKLHEHQLTAITKDTVLHVVAMYSGSVNCVEVLRNACPKLIKATNVNGDTAIHTAALSVHLELIKRLIDWAEDVYDLDDGDPLVRARNYNDGDTALHVGVRMRNVEVVEELIRADRELIHIRNFKGQSPFALASGAVKMKISHYMDIHGYIGAARREESNSDRIRATRPTGGEDGEQKNEITTSDAVETLDNQRGWNPLHYAVYHGITLNIEKALQRNIKYASEQDKSGQCPIHLAAFQGHLDCIQAMICEIEDVVHQKNRDGHNVFHVAAMTSNEEIMEYLLRNLSPEFKRHVNDVDNEGNTVLHLAVKNGNHAIVYMLVCENKSTVLDALNYEGFTPMDICEAEMECPPAQSSQLVILKILKAAKAKNGKKYVEMLRGRNSNDEKYKRKLEHYRGWIDTSLIVATLILAVTFAAGFAIPGDYHSDGPNNGMAILLNRPTFCIFVFFNTLATHLSLLIIVILLRVVLTSDFKSLSTAVRACTPLLALAVFFMAVAFTAGVFSMMSSFAWLAYTLLGICMFFTIVILMLDIAIHVLLSADFHVCFSFTYGVIVPLMLWLRG
ncbi:hypothetical protein Sjap_025634 [Stephania japonica]|uniref:PGG domain-containing protein n=1 Tax=Stephania japonica TaxID=461633 RepID=A0AAP0E9U2_9MAGN